MNGVIRQGDVALIPTKKVPTTAAKVVIDQGRTVLAYGEVTGHSHEVVPVAAPPARRLTHNDDCVPAQQLFEEPDGTRLLVIKSPCALQHQEHDPATLPAGMTYEVRRQSEWSLDQVRQVAD
jgi:hypothetical protein